MIDFLEIEDSKNSKNPEEIHNQVALDKALAPSNLFRNEEEIRLFIEGSTIPELIAFLKECENEELYEYCAIIRDKINSLKSETNLIVEIYGLPS